MKAPPRHGWDVHCRVVDNFGDLGVAWRLAADLASRGHAVRLWVDDPSALGWMAPAGAKGVDVRHQTAGPSSDAGPTVTVVETSDAEPAAIVVETFGCDLPLRVAD